MLSVTTGNPPLSSICIINDVPERGRPETIMISESIAQFLHKKSRHQMCTLNTPLRQNPDIIEIMNHATIQRLDSLVSGVRTECLISMDCTGESLANGFSWGCTNTSVACHPGRNSLTRIGPSPTANSL